MESIEHQEMRARREVNLTAALKVGAGLGVLLFIFPGGTPWTSGGTLNAVLGRPMPWPWFLILAVHLALCLAYMVVVANVVYRFKLIAAIGAGILTVLGLFAVNFAFFAAIMGFNQDLSNARSLVAHVIFGLFGTVIYKAISVPRPLPDDREVEVHAPLSHDQRR